MKIGDKVKTEFGHGVIVGREDDEGVLSHRFLVWLDAPPDLFDLDKLHQKQGGLSFWEKDITKLKKEK